MALHVHLKVLKMRAEIKARVVMLLQMAHHGIGLSVVLTFLFPSCMRGTVTATPQQTAIHHLLLFPFGNMQWNNTGRRGDDYSYFLCLDFADLSTNPL